MLLTNSMKISRQRQNRSLLRDLFPSTVIIRACFSQPRYGGPHSTIRTAHTEPDLFHLSLIFHLRPATGISLISLPKFVVSGTPQSSVFSWVYAGSPIPIRNPRQQTPSSTHQTFNRQLPSKFSITQFSTQSGTPSSRK